MSLSTQARPGVWLVNLFFGSGPSPTGVLMESLAVGLERAGYGVEVLTGRSGYNAGGASRPSRFAGHVHRMFSGWSGASGTLGRLISWLGFYLSAVAFAFTRPLPAHIVLMTTPPFLHAAFVARKMLTRSRAEIVLWTQDTYPEILASTGIVRTRSVVYKGMAALDRWATARVCRVVALDGAMADLLRTRRPADLRVIPNWHSDAEPAVDGDDEIGARIITARSRFRYVVLYTGNYGWGHDLSPLIDWLRADREQRNFYFAFVGGGVKWPALAALEAELGTDRVIARPYVSRGRVAALIAAADFGLVCLEPACAGLMCPSKIYGYLAAGKPLIYLGPPGTNVAEAIEEYGCGVRLSPDPTTTGNILRTVARPEFDFPGMVGRAAVAGRGRYTEAAGVAEFIRMMSGKAPKTVTPSRPCPT